MKPLFTFLFFFLLYYLVFPQNVIQIGDQNQVFGGHPIKLYQTYSYGQSIYQQRFIQAEGNIRAISYYYNGGEQWSDSILILMGHTSKNFFNDVRDWIPAQEMKEVFNGLINLPKEGGWVQIKLDSAFYYNNHNNLVIAFDKNTGLRFEVYGKVMHNSKHLFGDKISLFTGTSISDIKYDYDPYNPKAANDLSFNNDCYYYPNVKLEGDLIQKPFILPKEEICNVKGEDTYKFIDIIISVDTILLDKDHDWFSCSLNKSYNGFLQVYIKSIQNNTTFSPRKGNIFLKYNDVILDTIQIIQSPLLNVVSPDTIFMSSYQAGLKDSFSVVRSLKNWEVASSADWLDIKADTNANKIICISKNSNLTGHSRSTQIFLKTDGIVRDTVIFNQSEAYLGVNPTAADIANLAGVQYKFEIKTNLENYRYNSDADWLDIKLDTISKMLICKALSVNQTGKIRQAKIKLQNDGKTYAEINLKQLSEPLSEITIGNDSILTEPLPIDPFTNYSYSQTIYSQKLINAFGSINKIYFYYDGISTWTDKVEIYMGHTLKQSFANQQDWIPLNRLTRIYKGFINVNKSKGWIEIELDTAFLFNNVDNLVIAINEYTIGNHKEFDKFRVSKLSGQNISIYDQQGTKINIYRPAWAKNMSSFAPDIILKGELYPGLYFKALQDDLIFQSISGIKDTVQIITNLDEFSITTKNDWFNLQKITNEIVITTVKDNKQTIEQSADIPINYGDLNLTPVKIRQYPRGIDEIIVGKHELTDYSFPFSMYEYNYFQTIYPSEFINKKGFITKIAIDANGSYGQTYNDFIIYLGTTSKTVFYDNFDWLPVEDLKLVYQGILSSDAIDKWIEIPLDFPFEYNNAENLVLVISSRYSGLGINDDLYFTNSGKNISIVYQSDEKPDLDYPPEGDLYTYYTDLKITFSNEKPVYLTVSPFTNTVGPDQGGMAAYNVLTNITEWDVTSDVSWVEIIADQISGKIQCVAKDANPSYIADRIAKITVSGESYAKTVDFIQQKKGVIRYYVFDENAVYSSTIASDTLLKFYNYSQSIVKKEYLEGMKNITRIYLYHDEYQYYGPNSIRVYLGHTNQSTYADKTNWIKIEDLNLVYDGLLEATSEDGWVAINLDTPFQYDNNYNLIVAFDENLSSNFSIFKTFYGTITDYDNKSLYSEQFFDIDPSSPPEATEITYVSPVFSFRSEEKYFQIGQGQTSFSYKTGNIDTLSVLTNIEGYKINVDADWLEFEKDEKTSKIIIKTSTENNSESSREGFLKVMINDSLVYTYKIIQNPKPLFEEIQTGIEGFWNGYPHWGDFNNDGKLDVLLSTGKVYANLGNNIFKEFNWLLDNSFNYTDLVWDDWDNDNKLDIFTKQFGYQSVNELVFLNKDTVFEKSGFALSGYFNGVIVFGDMDNDRKPDILRCGKNSSDKLPGTYIEKNNGNFFSSVYKLRSLANGSVIWIDIENDIDLDAIITGTELSGNYYAGIFINQGNNKFTEVPSNILGLENSSMDIGDYDNDGDWDLLVTGYNFTNYQVTKIYRNDGKGIFIEMDAGLPGVSFGMARWGDMNNDGKLDVIITGNNYTGLYLNMGSNIFNKIKTQIPDLDYSGADFGDYDRDGDLDILIAGQNNGIKCTKLYKNNITSKNTKPACPSNLSSKVTRNSVIFKWDQSFDKETPVKGLCYNIKIGTTPGGCDIKNPNADKNGDLKVYSPDKYLKDTQYWLENLNEGIYYWSVQAIDNGFQSSVFAEEQTFSVLPYFSEADTLINNIDRNIMKWGDIDNDNDLDIISIGKSDQDLTFDMFLNDKGQFKKTSLPFKGTSSGGLDLGDFNNDGFVDIAVTGHLNEISGILINNKNGNFENSNIFTATDNYGNLKWADINRDGNLDLIFSSGSYFTIYNHTTENTLKEIMDSDLKPATDCSIDAGDYDNDGDMDILCIGQLNTGTHSGNIYRNDGNFNFSALRTDLAGLANGVCKWGDYNNDGNFDFLISGEDNVGNIFTKVYKNTGGNFTELKFDIAATTRGATDWGDIDNDGDLDILVLHSYTISKLYLNESEDSFHEIDLAMELSGISWDKSDFGDFDNDGDLDFVWNGIVYRNNSNYDNTLPSTPTNLKSELYGFGIKLNWEKSTDNSTPQLAITYNILIGTKPGGCDIFSPMADPMTGYLRIPKNGNMGTLNYLTLDTLPEGTYYWSVQAIDKSFSPTPFASEETFTINRVRADFKADTVCFGDTTHFTDLSLTGKNKIESWLWDFGKGITSTEKKPKFKFEEPGNHSVTLTAKSGEFENSRTKIVFVKPKPAAKFDYDIVCQGDKTHFYNKTIIDTSQIKIEQWLWSFGDGILSNMEDPEPHGYLKTGNFEARLKILAINGCSDSTIQNIIVTDRPSPTKPSTLGKEVEFCSRDSLKLFVDYNKNFSYKWMFDDTFAGVPDTNQYYFKVKGSYNVIITNTLGGCYTTTDKTTLVVKESPLSPNISSPRLTNEICEGDTILLSVTPLKGLIYHWKLNDGGEGFDLPYIYATKTGIYDIEVVNQNNCLAKSVNKIDIVVNETPKIEKIIPDKKNGIICQGDNVSLKVEKNENYTYQWYLDSIEIKDARDYFLDVTKEGSYLVKKTYKTCSSLSPTQSVTYKPGPPKPELIVKGPNQWYFICKDTTQKEYQWNKNGNLLDNPYPKPYIYIANQNYGTYRVVVSDGGECHVPSDDISIFPTGIHDPGNLTEINLFPVPVKDWLYIDIKQHIQKLYQIRIKDISGRQAMLKTIPGNGPNPFEINIESLNTGIYIIEITTDKMNISRQIMKE